MGCVKVDIYKKDKEAREINLGDYNHVLEMIRYWHRVKDLIGDINNTPSEQLLITYIDLFKLIEDAQLTNRQLEVIELFADEYDEYEIARELNITQSVVRGIIKSACKRIVQEFHRQWLVNTLFNYVPTQWKTCSKCKEPLPMSEVFFGKDDRNLDGFKSYCKKCDANSKKI